MHNNKISYSEDCKRFAGFLRKKPPISPFVSIVIATYNDSKYLELTLNSILNQDYKNIEIIIIDGGSNDSTINILKQYSDQVKYWISEPDDGISDAFNKGVLASSGDFINFQGSGDYLIESNVISRAMENIDITSDMFISCRIQRVSNEDIEQIKWVAPKVFKVKFDKRSLLFKMSLPHQGLLINRKFFQEYGFFDKKLKYSMDYEHLLRAYQKFPKIIMKNIYFSAWREGGVGTGRIREVLDEYHFIKVKNRIASIWILELINLYIKFKFYIRNMLNFFTN